MRLVRPRRNSCARPRIPPGPRVVSHLGMGWIGRPDRLCRFLVVAGASLAEERAIAERTNLILSDPASRLVTLQAKIGPQVHAFCHPKLGIILYGGSVPMPASNRTYQLWLVMKDKNAKPMSAAMFRPDASGKVMLMVPAMPAEMDSTAALAISEEPSGGSLQPTSTPIWVGALT